MASKEYRVLETSFINGRLVQAGEKVEFDGKPGANLEPIKAEKKAKDEKPGADQQPEDNASDPVI